MSTPAERVARLESENPDAAGLARLLSLAVRIEPHLVRRARLLLPGADASAEADLWFSDLLAAQNPRGISLDRDVAEVLRDQLAGDPERLDAAWGLVETSHRDAPWSIRVEEHVNRLSLSSDPADRERIEDLLLAAAREMTEAGEDKGPARWMVRALERLPREIRGSESSRMLAMGAGARLDGRLELGDEELPADAVESWFGWLFPESSPVEIGVRLLDGAVEAGALAGDGVHRLPVPPTRPLFLDVRWHDGRAQRAERLEIPEGETRRLRVGARAVELGTVLGDRFVLEASDAAGAGGFDFSGVRAAHRPFYGREKEVEEILAAVRAEERNGRVVGIFGAAGIGKTALLCRVLDRLEADGVPVIAHFLRAEPAAWSDRHALEASLLAQLRARLPEPEILEAPSLEQALAKFEDRLVETSLQRICIALDAGASVPEDEFESIHQSLAVYGPYRICLLWAARTEPDLDYLWESGTIITSIDLDERKESNEEVCERLLASRRDEIIEPTAETSGSRSPGSLELLTRRADGNVGRIEDMLRWLSEQERIPVDLERMPPTLYGAMERVWDELGPSAPDGDLVMAVLAAAFEPLPGDLPVTTAAERIQPRRVAELLERSKVAGVVADLSPQGAEPRIGPSDPSVRDWIVERLGTERMLEAHGLLADLLPDEPWTEAAAPDGFRRDYARRHQARHLIRLERWRPLHRLLSNLDFLTESCAEEGVDALAVVIAAAAGAMPDGELADDLGSILRALRADATRLRERPADLPSLLHGRLRAGGDKERLAAEALYSAAGRPYLWLRHVLHPPAEAVRDFAPAGEPLKSLTFHRGALYAGSMSGRTYAWRHGSDKPVRTLADHRGPVTVLVGKKGGPLLSGSRDGTLRLWIDGDLEQEIEGPGGEILGAWWLLGDGDSFAACAAGGNVLLWNQGKRSHLVGHAGAVTCCAAFQAFSEEGWLLTGSADCTLRIWDLPGGAAGPRLLGHAAPVTACIASSRDIYSGDAGGVVKRWSPKTGEVRQTFSGHRGAVTGLIDQHRHLISSSLDGTVRVWDRGSGRESRRLDGHRGEVLGLSAVAEGRVASFGRDGTVRLWDLEKGHEQARFETRGGAVRALEVVSGEVVDGELIAATEGGTIEVFPVDAGDLAPGRSTCALDPAASHVVVASGEPAPVLWDAREARTIGRLEASGALVPLCAVNGGGDFYLTADREGFLRYWSLEGAEIAAAEALSSERLGDGVELTALHVTHAGVLSFTGQRDGEITMWRRRSSRLVAKRHFVGHSGPVRALASDRDGRLLLSASDDGTLRLWAIETGEALATLQAHGGAVLACTLSRDGRRALSGGAGGVLELSDVDGGRKLRELHGHRGAVTACAFSDVDGSRSRALSTSADGTLKLWDLDAGECVETFYAPSELTDLDVAARAAAVAAAGAGGRCWILDLRSPS